MDTKQQNKYEEVDHFTAIVNSVIGDFPWLEQDESSKRKQHFNNRIKTTRPDRLCEFLT